MVETKELLPKRVVGYIHEMGVRSLDHLAENAGEDSSAAMQALIGNWKSMTAGEKEAFIARVADAVVEVVAASAALPVGLKLGKKAAKATGKVIRKQTKQIRKAAKKADKADKPKKAKAKKADKPKKAKNADQA